MLHLVFQITPEILERLENQTAVIFLNNAAFGLLKNAQWQEKLAMITPSYVLYDDLILRGIETHLLVDSITPITYTQFVKLTVENTPIQTWT